MNRPVEFASRLLFPFRFGIPEAEEGRQLFDPGILGDIAGHRIELRGKDGSVPVWEQAPELQKTEAREIDKGGLYAEEMLPQIADFFFRATGQRSGRYFRMSRECRERILPGKHWMWPGGREAGLAELAKPEKERKTSLLPIAIPEIGAVELFITGLGVGVISIAIAGSLGNPGFGFAMLRDLLYRITQKRGYRAPTLARVHPADDPDRWAKMSATHRAAVEKTPPCDRQAPIRERLGAMGGEWSIEELCRALLGPLAAPAESGQRTRYRLRVYEDAYQRQLDHYTVVRFESDVEFSKGRPHPDLTHELSALVQLEEPGHAGMMAGESSVSSEVLNRKHLAAAGSQGSVHFVADQHRPPSGFDHSRVRLVQDKYFMDFLLVYLQDQYLNLASRQCGELVDSLAGPSCEFSQGEFTALRSEILAFDSLCYLPRISHRESHNRYYRLVRAALGLVETFGDLATQMEDLDAACKHESSERTRREMRDLARSQHGIQVNLEWLEIFVVAAYSVYLINYIGEHFRFDHEYVAWWLVGGSATAGVLAALLLKPWKHAGAPRRGEDEPGRADTHTRGWFKMFLLVAAMAFLYIFCGKLWFS